MLHAFVRYAAGATLASLFLLSLLCPPGPASARHRHHGAFGQRQAVDGEPGQFDYYVLVLSWSPSFCADSAERNPERAARNPQCGPRPFSFVVHGLWPQYEKGYPQFCQVPSPRLNRHIVSDMLDLMPAPQLVYHEWDRHGVCSGLSPDAYFETIRKARAAVNIPPEFTDPSTELTVSPQQVEEAFIAANPAMPSDGISVACGSRRLGEVRICMTRDLMFRGCEQMERRSCRRDLLIMPPVRGG
jgi:ribonuclease T2